MVYRFNVTIIKLPTEVFKEFGKLVPKFPWKTKELQGKKQEEGDFLPWAEDRPQHSQMHVVAG